MKKIILIFIIFTFFSSCNNWKKDYKKYSELFIDSYNSLNYEDPEFKYNKIEISKTYKYLDKLKKLNSSSEEKYFFDLLEFRLQLIERNYDKAFITLESIREINPMMYNYYKAKTYELMKDYKNSLKYYNISLSKCGNLSYSCSEIEFLINNNLNTFLNNLKNNDTDAFNYYKKLKEQFNMSEVEIRKKILNQVFSNYTIPDLPDVFQ
jgi:hypothetical protein